MLTALLLIFRRCEALWIYGLFVLTPWVGRRLGNRADRLDGRKAAAWPLALPTLAALAVAIFSMFQAPHDMSGTLPAASAAKAEEVASTVPSGGQTTPMTYANDSGKQIVLIVAGGHGSVGTKPGDYVIAYTLPAK